jgi:Holliday junction resolvase RusA-like endonuclease
MVSCCPLRGVDMNVDVFIKGVPYAQKKERGDVKAPSRWTEAVKQATKNSPVVKGPCSISVFFALPADKYPDDHPYGPDLDNYLKRLFDALNYTIFSKVQGHDGAIVQLLASKHKALEGESTGARVIIQEM